MYYCLKYDIVFSIKITGTCKNCLYHLHRHIIMKKIFAAIILILIGTAVIVSAGCVSLGSTTTDILVGGEKVGAITLTPNQSGTSSGDVSLADKFDAEIELFGLKYTKGGLTKAESGSLLNTLSKNNLTLADLQGLLAGFTEVDKGAGPDDPGNFLDKLLHMPVSADNPTEFSEALDISGVGDNLNDAIEKLEKLLEGII